MKVKLNKNIFFDILILMIDILLVFFAAKVSLKILSYFITEDRMNSLLSSMDTIAVCYVISVLFMLSIYEFYSKTLRSKYEIIISVLIIVLISSVITFISEVFINRNISTLDVVFFSVMAFVLFIFICFDKLVLMYVTRKVEGTTRLLVIESKYVESNLARKIKYSYIKIYESWYIQLDINSQSEIDKLINVTFKEYESIFISPDIPIDLRNMLISNAISQHKEIYILPDLYNISVMKNETVQFEDTPALRIKPFGLKKSDAFFKRFLDVAVSLVGIVVTFPIMLIAALLIKIDSKGPIIYKQERVTLDRKLFNVYKFRTMNNDAEKFCGAVLATENDCRITRVGKILRMTRLDELPQFFNILFGHMSIVGPRPERPVFVEQYEKEIENYDKRFFVKAGLTGLAQVYARYDTTAKDKTLYDLLYIKDYSFFQDLKLILLTIKIMFIKESSEGVQTKPKYLA